jgi:acyl-CoA synthetase (AMP-forming)/AMP-acid ligase II
MTADVQPTSQAPEVRLTESYWPMTTATPLLDTTAGDLLRAAADAEPDRLALVEVGPADDTLIDGVVAGSRTWTYAALLAEAEQAAQWLLSQFAPGERIAVWAPNLPEWVVLQYATGLAGMVLVPVNPALRGQELSYVLGQSGAVGLVYLGEFRGSDMAATVREILPGLPRVRVTLTFGNWDRVVRGFSGGDRPLPAVRPEDPAQVQYTSGTTGFPKGAVLHHRGLVANAYLVHRRAEFPVHGTWLTALPLFHTAGCGMSVLGTAASRGTLVLGRFFEPGMLLAAAERWSADFIGGVPAMMGAFLQHPDLESFDLSALKVVASGGDTVPAQMVRAAEERMGARFSTVYGQTELSPIVTQTSPSDSPEVKAETAGRPLDHVRVKVVDPATGRTVPCGETGEICAVGYQVMTGYLDMPDATAETIDAAGWVHTGDLGTMDERGFVRITGRIKDMIIRGGENIYPREIEAALVEHPGVADALVVGIPSAEWGETVAAVIRAADAGQLPTATELHEHLRARLAPHKTPKQWFVAEQFPANAMGKLQKFRVKDAIMAGELTPLQP